MTGALHHVELWVPDLAGAIRPWGWLFTELGWTGFQDWPGGRSWRRGETYVVLEQSPALSGPAHDRRAPGLNHLAFTAGPRTEVDRLHELAPDHGWSPMFPDRYPHAGGPDSYATYLEDPWGYEVELVAED
ncbi:VOC family protein [Actinoplanes couchii]|uniref:VOC domain-containing protein n=1 Tax=Actinoplanes couchii TaxID=403638 RepID=A0ABQ3X674_9ACTN|nr:VOC family protein [Actinoplanes couchii]MDR6325414.1 catechol 2,3-dioxygenase-like lactoylglutathione lyase family enzyme [Actinoplanes couchii]GID53883.1 hypothetical protein Aco03nite_022870 [Actinoplanes couchii]